MPITERPIVSVEYAKNGEIISKLLDEIKDTGTPISANVREAAIRISKGLRPTGITPEMFIQGETVVIGDLIRLLDQHGIGQGYRFGNFFNALGWMKAKSCD